MPVSQRYRVEAVAIASSIPLYSRVSVSVGGLLISYNAKAASEAWALTLAYLANYAKL